MRKCQKSCYIEVSVVKIETLTQEFVIIMRGIALAEHEEKHEMT